MVKCIECGYLGVQDEYNKDVCEATFRTREKGEHESSLGNVTRARFLCFVGSPCFPLNPSEKLPPLPTIRVTQFSARPSPSEGAQEARLRALSNPVDCSQFRKWIPGRKPKEHEEMSVAEMVDARLNKWRDEDVKWRESVESSIDRRFEASEKSANALLEKQQEFEQRLEALREQRHQETLGPAKGSNRIAIVALIVALLGVIVAVIGLVVNSD